MAGRPTRCGPAGKGSRYCLQQFVEKHAGRLEREILSASPKLHTMGARAIDWLSPLARENYLEYRDDFLAPLGLQAYEPQLRSFWPTNGPQWDGLATIDLTPGRAVLLIEAKAYPAEVRSACGAKDPKSVAAIRCALEEVRTYNLGLATAERLLDQVVTVYVEARRAE